MRRFLHDIILRSAEIIQERDRKAQAPAPLSVIHTHGRPSRCMFCEDRPAVVVVDGGKQAFACAEHLGSLVVDWTTAHELIVVRL